MAMQPATTGHLTSAHQEFFWDLVKWETLELDKSTYLTTHEDDKDNYNLSINDFESCL